MSLKACSSSSVLFTVLVESWLSRLRWRLAARELSMASKEGLAAASEKSAKGGTSSSPLLLHGTAARPPWDPIFRLEEDLRPGLRPELPELSPNDG